VANGETEIEYMLLSVQ